MGSLCWPLPSAMKELRKSVTVDFATDFDQSAAGAEEFD